MKLLNPTHLSLRLYFLLLQKTPLLLGQLLQLLGLALGSLDLGLLLSDQMLGLLVLLGAQLALKGVKLASVL